MTVQQLLDAIAAAYPGASPEAMATFKPVFFARFEKRQGPHLEQAFRDTLATFKATARQPFPIPANIEDHLPRLTKAAEKHDKPIRESLERRDVAMRVLVNNWLIGQGAKIKQERATPLYAACLLEAMEQARKRALDERVTRIVLDQAKLAECYQRALSSERQRRHGRADRLAPAAWWEQLTAIAAEWNFQITPEWWSKDTAAALNPKAEAA